MMSGLPGAGKDFWVAENLRDLPVISLDALRRKMKVASTSASRCVNSPLTSSLLTTRACASSTSRPWRRTFSRRTANPVPAEVISKLTARWEVPDLTEAHRIEWVTQTLCSATLITF